MGSREIQGSRFPKKSGVSYWRSPINTHVNVEKDSRGESSCPILNTDSNAARGISCTYFDFTVTQDDHGEPPNPKPWNP